MNDNTVLILATYRDKSNSEFPYPELGPFEWSPLSLNDVHNQPYGLLRGEGPAESLDMHYDAIWLVIRALESDLVKDGNVVKFSKGEVIYAGTREIATSMLKAEYPWSAVVCCIATPIGGAHAISGAHGVSIGPFNGDNAISGESGIAIAGDYSKAETGYAGRAVAGENGKAYAGADGRAEVGRNGSAKVGERGIAIAGDYGTATAGDHGKAIAGACGMAKAGNYGIATAGTGGTAIVGENGIASVGNNGFASAGANGEIRISWLDMKSDRYRTIVGYVGEDIEAGSLYSVINGKLVRKPCCTCGK